MYEDADPEDFKRVPGEIAAKHNDCPLFYFPDDPFGRTSAINPKIYAYC
jgi:hypothetical protein